MGGARGQRNDKTAATVTVTLPSGESLQGQLVRIDDFVVTLKLSDGAFRTFTRKGDLPKIMIEDPLRAHRTCCRNIRIKTSRCDCLPGDLEMIFPKILLPATLLLVSMSSMGQAGGVTPEDLLKPLKDSWPTYNGDYTGRRFSALTQVNRANVKHLTLAWASQVIAGADNPEAGGEERRGNGLETPDRLSAAKVRGIFRSRVALSSVRCSRSMALSISRCRTMPGQ